MARKKNPGLNVTLQQVAATLGVSTMTVSRVVNNSPNVGDKTRKRVLKKAKEMGYTPNHVARSLVSSKTFTIGVIIPKISHSFFPGVILGIEDATWSSNYQLFLVNTNESFGREKKAIEALRSKRVDGILVSSSQNNSNSSFYGQIARTALPLVFFDRYIEHIGKSCIGVDDEAGSRNITEHLIGHGYKNIACLCGPKKVTIADQRLNGYLQAMKKQGLPVNDQWVVEGGFREVDGFEGMKKLLDLPKSKRPRAVVAVNDPVAFGAIEAIRKLGLSVPDDIAIVGFTDEIRSALISCPLTTVHQPAYDIGKAAAEKLLRTIDNKEEPVEYIEVPTSLKIRSSCGCA